MTTATTNGHRTAELTPPHDPLAEKTLLGFVLTAGRIPEPAADLKPDDFYQPAHTLTWQVAVELTRQGATPDLPAVVSRLTETGRLHRAGGAGYLASLLAPPPADNAQLVAVIRDRAGRRRLIQAAETITAKAYRSAAPFIDQVETAEALLAGTVTDDADDLTTLLPLEDFVARDLGPQQWVIPGILERRERLIFTGNESLGKSTLVRQLAVCAAAGMDPFLVGRHSANPQSVLFVDCENPDRLMLDRFAALKRAVAAHGYPVPYPGLWIERREQGMDLFDPADRRWLQRRIDAVRPDVLFIGALYKMFRGDSNDERVIIDVVRVLDEIRVRNDVALVMEHHQAKGGSGDRHRPVAPVGSSVWLRWVDSGYGLRPVERPDVPVVQQERDRLAELVPWKKRDERRMPRFVKSGGEFMPWVETDEEGR